MTTQASKTPPAPQSPRLGSITVCVFDVATGGMVEGGQVSLFPTDQAFTGGSAKAPASPPARKEPPSEWPGDKEITPLETKYTDGSGCTTFPDLEPGHYVVDFENYPLTKPQCVTVDPGCVRDVLIDIDLNVQATLSFRTSD